MKNILEKPFSFIKTTLQSANIYLPDIWIKNELQKLREEKFPSNALYLSKICGIAIDLGKRKEISNLIFCQKGCAFPNIKHNNKTELYYIFASQIQINLFYLYEYLFIDATFKRVPKGFYQVLNVI